MPRHTYKRKAKSKGPGLGRSGKPPPTDGKFKKGFDPKRGENRETAGAIVKNYINGFARRATTTAELKIILLDDAVPPLMQAAAEQILHSRRRTTQADFEPWLNGEKSLVELAAEGVDVSVVKRTHVGRRRTITDKEGNVTIEDGERNIELLIDEGHNLDRIIEQTDGKPKLTAEIQADVIFRTPADRDLAATKAAERLRKVFKAPKG